nr:MAG TPA: hypothetical protein [Caudoviricetes sp.]
MTCLTSQSKTLASSQNSDRRNWRDCACVANPLIFLGFHIQTTRQKFRPS